MHIPTRLAQKFYKLASADLIDKFNAAVRRNELAPGNMRAFTFGAGYSFLEGLDDFVKRIHRTTEKKNGDLIIPGSFFLPAELFGALNDAKKILNSNENINNDKSFVTSMRLNREDHDGKIKQTKVKLKIKITRQTSAAYNCELVYESV